MNKKLTLISAPKFVIFPDEYYKRPQGLTLMKILLLLIGILMLVNLASAVNLDIGCPYTYHKNAVNVDKTQKYTQFAYRYNYSHDLQINRIGLYRFWTDGIGGPYDIRVVNDKNGVPGDIVYAQNLGFKESTGNRAYAIVPLNTTFKLPANIACWVVIDGKNATLENSTAFSTFDRAILPDLSYGFDFQRWKTAGWNGTAWITPAFSGSNYPMYGCVAAYNNNTILGDGQFAMNEATFITYADHYDGQKITNAPSEPFKINDMKIRMISVGNYGPVYFAVLDYNLNEIANRTIVPTDNGTWIKQTYTFSPPIDIGAGNSTIICIIKAPKATDWSNGIQVRGIQYVSNETSYPNGTRFATGTGGLSNVWTDAETLSMDAMMNFSITCGETSSEGTPGVDYNVSPTGSNPNTGNLSNPWQTVDYYVSPTGSNSNTGNLSNPWQTLAFASSHLPANSNLHVMNGIYAGDTLSLGVSNITVSAYSGNPIISGSNYGIQGYNVSNIIVSNLTFIGQTATSLSFIHSNNIKVSGCTIRDGVDGIRFKGCNDTLSQGNTITNMTDHGIHIFNQELQPIYVRNNIIGNNVSNCGHNMIDIHSNVSSSTIAQNDIYFTDAWTGNKNNIGMFLHNGNTPYLIIENNTFHHMGRLLELNNVNDCIIRNNNFYDGLAWGTSSSSRILMEAENGTVPCSPFGSNNVTFSGNKFDGIGYPVMFYSYGVANAIFTNITFRNNTYTNVGISNLRKATLKPTTNIVFKDEKFANFTISWDGNNIHNGDVKFENTSSNAIYSDGTNKYSISNGVVVLDIDNSTTDIWYGDIVSAPLNTIPVANFSSNVTSGFAPLNVLFTDVSTGKPTSWNWNFGDGTNSIQQSPVHTYSAAGNYTVTLTANNAQGSNTTTKTSYIKVQEKTLQTSIVEFSASQTSGNAPLKVTFTDKSTGMPTSWNWSFGDGTHSTNKNTTHTYYTNGSYSVSLTISDPNGIYTKEKESYIDVLRSPTINQTANISFNHSDFSINVGSTKDLHILVEELPDGLSGYNITTEFLEPEIVEIEAVTFPEWAIYHESSSCPSNSIWMSAPDLESNVNPGDKYVLLGIITVRGKGVGTANMSISVTKMDDDGGIMIHPNIVVRSLIPFTGCTDLPTDPDGDGLYEDINGNNRIDYDDVSMYHKNISWIPQYEPLKLFDYNLNGRIDYNDANRLYKEI